VRETAEFVAKVVYAACREAVFGSINLDWRMGTGVRVFRTTIRKHRLSAEAAAGDDSFGLTDQNVNCHV
jgi:hypothetical protein